MYLTQRQHMDKLMVIVFIAMIGIKALFFGNKNSDKNRLIDLNNELPELYKKLAETRDELADKRQSYEKAVEAITCKRSEVDNRLDYLNGVKTTMTDKLASPCVDLKEFKELCEQYVVTFSSTEEAQTELHSLEVELENTYATWEDEEKGLEFRIQSIGTDIQEVLHIITKLSDKKK
jgi:uncharacterized coiled-coil DUF342 family protein